MAEEPCRLPSCGEVYLTRVWLRSSETDRMMTAIIKRFPCAVAEKWHQHLLSRPSVEQVEPFSQCSFRGFLLRGPFWRGWPQHRTWLFLLVVRLTIQVMEVSTRTLVNEHVTSVVRSGACVGIARQTPNWRIVIKRPNRPRFRKWKSSGARCTTRR